MDDLHGIRPRPAQDLVQANFSQRIRFKIWTVFEVGMKFKHFKRERVLHDDRTEIVPNGAVLQTMVLTNCTPAPTPSVVGSVKQKVDDDVSLDMQERRIYRGIVGSLQYLSIDRCDLHFETNVCAKEMKQPTEASWWTRLKLLARYLARAQSARVFIILNRPCTAWCIFASLVGQWFGWKCRGQQKSIEFENWSRCMSVVFCIKQTDTRALKWRSWVPRCTASATNEAMLIREVSLVHGTGSPDRTLAGKSSARGRCRWESVGTTRHLSTHVLCLQQLVNRGAVTVGACVHPQRTAQNLIQNHYLFTHFDSWCSGTDRCWTDMRIRWLATQRMDKTRMSSKELQCKQSLVLGKATERIGELNEGYSWDELSIKSGARCSATNGWHAHWRQLERCSVGHWEMVRVVVTQVYERTKCVWLLANRTFLLWFFLLMLCIRHCAFEQQ